jgi:hypothetical protein
MTDEKISELPVATSVASPDVIPVVQGGITKRADVSLIGSFPSVNIARVDPSGSDSAGTVGDLSKPFLTVQGSINAIESGSYANPIIDIGNPGDDLNEDLTTSLPNLHFKASDERFAPFHSLSCSSDGTYLQFTHINLSGGIAANSTGGLSVDCHDSYIGNLTNTSGPIFVSGAAGSKGSIYGTVSCPGFNIYIINMDGDGLIGNLVIDSAGSNVVLRSATVNVLTAAASISLTDARIVTNSAGITPTYTDVLLAGRSIIFPDADPHLAGAGYWSAGILTRSNG